VGVWGAASGALGLEVGSGLGCAVGLGRTTVETAGAARDGVDGAWALRSQPANPAKRTRPIDNPSRRALNER